MSTSKGLHASLTTCCARVPPGPGRVYAKGIPGYAFGAGPAYLSGQIMWYSGPPGQAALVLIDGTYTEPILIRVRRLDGGGGVTLADLSIPPRHRLAAMLPAGTATSDGAEVVVPPITTGWSAWEGRLRADSAGCYALQVDGNRFTSVVVFAVQPGPDSTRLSCDHHGATCLIHGASAEWVRANRPAVLRSRSDTSVYR
jgi:hypothetical protein